MQLRAYRVNLKQRLDTGLFGFVYRGSHISTGTQVVIKRVKRDEYLQKSTLQEIEALQNIKHENIVELLTVYNDAKNWYIILEYCDQGNLETYLRIKKPSLQDKLKIMYQCSSAVYYLHYQKPCIVHRDIKPAHILMKKDENGEDMVKLSGFQWSKRVDEDNFLMASDTGTLVFRAPELLIKKNHNFQYTASVDVFALGLVFKAILDYGCESQHLDVQEVSMKGEDDWMLTYAMSMVCSKQLNRKSPALFAMRADDTDMLLQLKMLVTNMTAYESSERPDMAHVRKFLAILGQNKSFRQYTASWVELHTEQGELRKAVTELSESNSKYREMCEELQSEQEQLRKEIAELRQSLTHYQTTHHKMPNYIPEAPYTRKFDDMNIKDCNPDLSYKQVGGSELLMPDHFHTLPYGNFGLDKKEIESCQPEKQLVSSETVMVKSDYSQLEDNIQEELQAHQEKPANLKPIEPSPNSTEEYVKDRHFGSLQRATMQFEKEIKMVSTELVGEPDGKIDDAKALAKNYKLLLSDLESSPVIYIQTIYKDMERKKIVVDIEKGNHDVACEALRNLQNSNKYYEYLDVMECELGELLMQAGHLSNPVSDFPQRGHLHYNIRIGSGSLIGCVNVCGAELQDLIKDRDMRCINDIHKKYPSTTRGTLTCILKHNTKYYTMTAQHVLDKEQFFSNQKQVFSQVHYECDELLLADIVNLASCYTGQMNTISVNGSKKAVDVALMPISQCNLDEALLNQLPVYYRADFENATQDFNTVLMHKRVKKVGAITGETEGKIISTDCVAKLDPKKLASPQGEMFAVVGLSKTTKSFAEQGDSGSLVTIKLNQSGKHCQYALGIIAQRRPRFLGRENVTLCVRMEDCLKALESATELDEPIDSRALEVYVGFLRPFASVHDRTMPHVEVNNTSTADRNERLCVYTNRPV